jgi:hypothetical protein
MGQGRQSFGLAGEGSIRILKPTWSAWDCKKTGRSVNDPGCVKTPERRKPLEFGSPRLRLAGSDCAGTSCFYLLVSVQRFRSDTDDEPNEPLPPPKEKKDSIIFSSVYVFTQPGPQAVLGFTPQQPLAADGAVQFSTGRKFAAGSDRLRLKSWRAPEQRADRVHDRR